VEEAGRQSGVGVKEVFHAWKRSVVSGKCVIPGWRGVWIECASILRQCSGSRKSADLVAGSGRGRKAVWHSRSCSFPCFGQFYVFKRFSMSGNRWKGYALWLRTLHFLQVVREIDKNWVQCVIIALMCSLRNAHMLFSTWKSFRPTLYFPQRWSNVGTHFQQLQGTTCHNNHKSACCKFC